MKRFCALLLVLLICSAAGTAEPITEYQITAALDAALANRIPSGYLLDVGTGLGTVDVNLIGLEHLTRYGEYIYYLMLAVEDIFPDAQTVEFSLSDGSTTSPKFLKFTAHPQIWDGIRYGKLEDFRGPSPVEYDLTTLDDLIALFPAMRTYGIGSGASQADIDLYNEVMDILESDYSRSEEEILEEIAPNYGMTPAELYDFLNNMLIAIYE